MDFPIQTCIFPWNLWLKPWDRLSQKIAFHQLSQDGAAVAVLSWKKKGSGTGHSEIWKGLLMSHPYMFSQSCLVLPEFLDPTLGDLGNGHG